MGVVAVCLTDVIAPVRQLPGGDLEGAAIYMVMALIVSVSSTTVSPDDAPLLWPRPMQKLTPPQLMLERLDVGKDHTGGETGAADANKRLR